MINNLTAPKIQWYINYLGNINDAWHNRNGVTYDPESYRLLDNIFALLRRLEPANQNGTHILWFNAPRGSIEDFGDFDEMLAAGEVQNRGEFENLWKLNHPDETEWYGFSAKDDDEGFRIITLAQRTIIMHSPYRSKSDSPYEVSEFLQWLYEKVASCVREIEEGTYRERIQRELPVKHRKGIILRKDYWDIFPEKRKEFFGALSQQEVEEFLHYISDQGSDDNEPEGRISELTANEFYKCCALGYAANNYKHIDLSPREQYYKNADGRDDGLKNIDPDSPADFRNWLHHRRQIGGHPWEVCRGGSFTSIHLYVFEDEKGYYYQLAGSATTRTVETIRFYLALRRAGIPVALFEGSLLAARITETEPIGIVPQGILPAYCHSFFPKENIKSFINLPLEKTDLVSRRCMWQEVELSRLKGK